VICSGCHRPAAGYDHLAERRFEFIPRWGFLVFLLYRMRRVHCRICGLVVEEVPWATGKHQLTKGYLQFLAHGARPLSWQETAEAFRTSWEKVCQAVEYVVTWGLEHRTRGSIQASGVDEIQYAKGHKYLTLVYQIDAQLTRLLWLGKERTVETLEGFFTMIGKELAAQIEFVCSDMWKPYLRVIGEKCSPALHILDRFHIMAKMNEALDDVRAAESRKMAEEGHEPLLKKSPWCVLKRKANLTPQQRFRRRDLLRYNLKTVRAYLLKEDFQQFREYDSPPWAGKFLDEWCRQTMRSRIEPMKKIAKMLRAHRDLILNYFKAKKQFSSGVVEGLNNKAKVTMRKSYGFRTFRITELALYHALGKLPEPELTHEFY
jgi:transposase